MIIKNQVLVQSVTVRLFFLVLKLEILSVPQKQELCLWSSLRWDFLPAALGVLLEGSGPLDQREAELSDLNTNKLRLQNQNRPTRHRRTDSTFPVVRGPEHPPVVPVLHEDPVTPRTVRGVPEPGLHLRPEHKLKQRRPGLVLNPGPVPAVQGEGSDLRQSSSL